jgi:membrane-bound metal-dependent hydrolase YbcI (DUF457 family)
MVLVYTVMPQAVTHVILTIVLIDIFRDYIAKKKFPRWFVLVGGIAGLFPDIDMPFGWVFNFLFGTSYDFHGGVTHYLIVPIIIAIAAWILFNYKQNKLGLILGLVAFGWTFHIFLDCIFVGGYFPFWPFLEGCCLQYMEESSPYMAGLDAIVLLFWLVHEEIAHKIRDYI